MRSARAAATCAGVRLRCMASNSSISSRCCGESAAGGGGNPAAKAGHDRRRDIRKPVRLSQKCDADGDRGDQSASRGPIFASARSRAPCPVARALQRLRPARAPCVGLAGASCVARSAVRATTSDASSASDCQRPTPSPASAAAPKAVVSVLAGLQYRHAEQVGLELHQQIVARGAAIDAQLGQRSRRHRWRMASMRSAVWKAMLSSAARAMCARVRAAREADDGAARCRIPLRRAEAGEGRHEVDVAGVGHAGGQRLDVGGALDDAEAVAQPLHRGAAHEHAAFERVLAGRRGARPPSSAGGGARPAACVAGVHQHEAAGAVGVLGHARREAGLAEQRRLLVAGDAGQR